MAFVNNQGGMNSLSSIKMAMQENSSKLQKGMTYDETYDYVSHLIEEDKFLKIRETQKSTNFEKITKDKAYYKENFSFYFEMVKTSLLSNGIKTYKKVGDENVLMSVDEVATDITAGYVGFDCLEDALNDPSVTDIFVISYNTIFIEKNGNNEIYPKTFRSAGSYKNFVDRILRDAGKQLDSGENKIVDFELYGNRGNVITDSISTKGICLTLRKHGDKPIQLKDMIEHNLMTQEIADLLGMAIEGETNLIYAGITGSGKTTTLRALLNNYIENLNKRVLVLEDTQELFLSNPHTVDLTTFHSDNPNTNIDLRDLIITALRMKPKTIVVGEIRGQEAEAAVEAMETGHSTLFSMHGGKAWNVINRLVTKYLMQMPTLGIQVVERILGEAINLVCIQADVPGIGRRVISIHEISYDYTTNHIVPTPIVEFDFENGTWIWKNILSKDMLNTMNMRGVSYERTREINRKIKSRITQNEV